MVIKFAFGCRSVHSFTLLALFSQYLEVTLLLILEVLQSIILNELRLCSAHIWQKFSWASSLWRIFILICDLSWVWSSSHAVLILCKLLNIGFRFNYRVNFVRINFRFNILPRLFIWVLNWSPSYLRFGFGIPSLRSSIILSRIIISTTWGFKILKSLIKGLSVLF